MCFMTAKEIVKGILPNPHTPPIGVLPCYTGRAFSISAIAWNRGETAVMQSVATISFK